MIVTVIDRGPPDRRDYLGAWTRTVEIADRCPECGGPRGEPKSGMQCEDGDWLVRDTWDNPCGHRDTYAAVLVEAGVYRGPVGGRGGLYCSDGDGR